ncbi:membrane-spanning 4-domains subfamily A member 18-like [Leptodactylus fuscus]|uniref:membrane-spanning 4-domains subfamily A member 18-like n=1 Tax=Leptodactylus fuscus TaxID=238119 RepID=UPI003F4E73BD
MSTANKAQNLFSVPAGAPPPLPNFMAIQYQWNVVPGPNGANVYPVSSPWTIPQVGPQYFPSSPAQQWTGQPVVTGQNIPNGLLTPGTGEAAWHQEFIKGKPKVLGIILIVLTICQLPFLISFALIASGYTSYNGILYWGIIFYIIAGSFTIRAQKKQNIRLVRMSFGFSIVSSINSLIGLIINLVDLVLMQCKEDYGCYRKGNGAETVVSFILVLHVLVFCVTVSISVFGGRGLRQVASDVPQVLVIQKMGTAPPTGYPENPSETPTSPPPYEIEEKTCLKNTDY